MAQVIAAQQGLAVANGIYASQATQDFLSSGSITHKLLYAGILGGSGYVIGTLVFGQGLAGNIKDTSKAVVGGIPILGTVINLIDDQIDPPKEKTFLEEYGAALAGASGAVIGFMIG